MAVARGLLTGRAARRNGCFRLTVELGPITQNHHSNVACVFAMNPVQEIKAIRLELFGSGIAPPGTALVSANARKLT